MLSTLTVQCKIHFKNGNRGRKFIKEGEARVLPVRVHENLK